MSRISPQNCGEKRASFHNIDDLLHNFIILDEIHMLKRRSGLDLIQTHKLAIFKQIREFISDAIYDIYTNEVV